MLSTGRPLCLFTQNSIHVAPDASDECDDGVYACTNIIDSALTNNDQFFRPISMAVSIRGVHGMREVAGSTAWNWYAGGSWSLKVDAEGLLTHELGHALGYWGDPNTFIAGHHEGCCFCPESNTPTMAPGGHWSQQSPQAPLGGGAMQSLESLDEAWVERDFCIDDIVAVAPTVELVVEECRRFVLQVSGHVPVGSVFAIRQNEVLLGKATVRERSQFDDVVVVRQPGTMRDNTESVDVVWSNSDGAESGGRRSVPLVEACEHGAYSLRSHRSDDTRSIMFTIIGEERGDTTTSLDVSVYTVGGRKVRTLRVPSGAQRVEWDERDELGRAVAPGIYLGRLGGRRTSASTKVLVGLQ